MNFPYYNYVFKPVRGIPNLRALPCCGPSKSLRADPSVGQRPSSAASGQVTRRSLAQRQRAVSRRSRRQLRLSAPSLGPEAKGTQGAPSSRGTFHTSCAAPPNGSRLSCAATAGGRKRPVLRYLLSGAQAHYSFESRPRQLQVLVRQHREPWLRNHLEVFLSRPPNLSYQGLRGVQQASKWVAGRQTGQADIDLPR